jgi:hypothetical protein
MNDAPGTGEFGIIATFTEGDLHLQRCVEANAANLADGIADRPRQSSSAAVGTLQSTI